MDYSIFFRSLKNEPYLGKPVDGVNVGKPVNEVNVGKPVNEVNVGKLVDGVNVGKPVKDVKDLDKYLEILESFSFQ
jgi:hypothetical protein